MAEDIIVNLPTYEQAVEILDKVLNIDTKGIGVPNSTASNSPSGNAHAKINWLLSIIATVNTNTATANLGAPSASPSNVTSAVAHAKLNWLLDALNQVKTNTNVSLKRVGSDGATFIEPASLSLAGSGGGTSFLAISGSGRLLGVAGTADVTLLIDNSLYLRVTKGGYLNIPFKTALRIGYIGTTPPTGAIYELNT